MRRDHRLFVGIDAADGGVHVVKRRTYSLHDAAVGAFQLLAGANEVVLRLFDLRGHRATLIQWQREVQADLVLPGIVILVLLRIIMGF